MRFAPARWVRCTLAVLTLTVAFGASSTSRAAMITFSFAGIVDSVDPALAGTFAPGQALSGTYSFLSTTPAQPGSTSTFAVFNALTSLDFTIGGYSATTTGAPEIQIDNNPPLPFHDRYAVLARASDGLTGPAVAGQALDAFSFRLDDSTNSVFSDALILPTTLDLSDFDGRQFFVFFGPITSPSLVSGRITALQAVPEPSTMTLAVIGGLSAMGLWRMRRRTA